jgi:hypothetical protein
MNVSRFTACIPKGYVTKGKTKEIQVRGPLGPPILSTRIQGNPPPSSVRCAQSSGCESPLTTEQKKRKDNIVDSKPKSCPLSLYSNRDLLTDHPSRVSSRALCPNAPIQSTCLAAPLWLHPHLFHPLSPGPHLIAQENEASGSPI